MTRRSNARLAAFAGSLALGAWAPAMAGAQDAAAPPVADPSAAPAKASEEKIVVEETATTEKKEESSLPFGMKIYGEATAGITLNPDKPNDRQNFGRVFDDRSNSPLLNQAIIIFEKPIDPLSEKLEWGFKLSLMYGSDARFIHSVGLLDEYSNDRLQFDIVEAYLNFHFPVLTKHGIDVKVGKFVTLEGIEVIPASGNFFYSHSYIFNFGIPLTHTGVMVTTHLTDHIDLFTGAVDGVNTSVTDNNDSWTFHGGVGFNYLDGALTILASTSIGPETPGNDTDDRYLNDIAVIWKVTDKLTSMTDINYAHDSGGAQSDAYGIAQYLTYQINDKLAIGVRGEIFRDDDGFYVAQFAENDDFNDIQRGDFSHLDPRTVGGGPTTYTEFTVGLNYTPIENLTIRPELRYDYALDNQPYDDSSDNAQFTAALAVTYKF